MVFHYNKQTAKSKTTLEISKTLHDSNREEFSIFTAERLTFRHLFVAPKVPKKTTRFALAESRGLGEVWLPFIEATHTGKCKKER